MIKPSLLVGLARAALVIVGGLLIGCSGASAERPINGPWVLAIDSLNRGLKEQWYATTYDRSVWSAEPVPAHWSSGGRLDAYDGIGWYATVFDAPDTTSDLSLYFAGVDDDATVWLNGKELGGHEGYNETFAFRVTGLLRARGNQLVIRVVDHSGPGGLYAPVSIISTQDADRRTSSPYAAKTARVSQPWSKGLIYELFPRSFSTDHRFATVEHRLDELADLGVTVLWIMPIHPVGELNRKGTLGSPYAVADYRAVDPSYGTIDDLRSLVRSAHAKGIRVIIDLVANHTAWDNRWLVEHPEWYTHNADGAIVAPNVDWTDVADLNYDRHELQKAMIEVMKFWVTECDIDGYRCDVAEMVPTSFWEVARRELDKIKPVTMLAEGSLPEQQVEAFDITYAWNTYDMFGRLMTGDLPAHQLFDMIRKEHRRFPKGALRLRFNTNHDKNAWDAPAVVKFGTDGSKLASVVAYTFPGVPLLYNGEEVGNQKQLGLFEAVPIDWSVGASYRSFYRTMGNLRREYPWLADAPLDELQHTGGSSVIAYLRRPEGGSSAVVCVLNFGTTPSSVLVDLPEDLGKRSLHQIFGSANLPPAKQLAVELPAHGFAIYVRP